MGGGREKGISRSRTLWGPTRPKREKEEKKEKEKDFPMAREKEKMEREKVPKIVSFVGRKVISV